MLESWRVHAWFLRVLPSFLFAPKERNAICALCVRLPSRWGWLNNLGWVWFIIMLCIYKFVTTNTFNCHDTIAFMNNPIIILIKRSNLLGALTRTGDPLRMVCTRAMGIFSRAAKMKQRRIPPKIQTQIKISCKEKFRTSFWLTSMFYISVNITMSCYINFEDLCAESNLLEQASLIFCQTKITLS